MPDPCCDDEEEAPSLANPFNTVLLRSRIRKSMRKFRASIRERKARAASMADLIAEEEENCEGGEPEQPDDLFEDEDPFEEPSNNHNPPPRDYAFPPSYDDVVKCDNNNTNDNRSRGKVRRSRTFSEISYENEVDFDEITSAASAAVEGRGGGRGSQRTL